ncbi:MAG TPA: NAD(P)/FAD-dependent oxidoreductase [Longimicrobium sp.]|nr:NAD(P)/FAD-dependent oxidoreductase [Longimicrobium sp.]
MATRVLAVPNVVIIGGGFGGLWAAKGLRKAPVSVTLVDRRNHHLFQPLLYQVATASLSPADIATPIRGVLRAQRNTEVTMGEVVDVDRVSRQILLSDGTRMPYDYLIVATGATHAYFGHPEWEPIAPGLKTVEDATEIRRRFLLAFEAAEQEADDDARRALLTFVIVGAGPTGVEMSGAMAEIARKSMVRDFRHIDPSTARVILVEGGPRVLAAYQEELSAYAQRALERIGVEVRLNSIVTKVDEGGVYIGSEFIPARNVVWAAGVTASPLGKRLDAKTDKVGRVHVNPDLSLPGDPRVFVLGDLANVLGPDGKPYPGVAQVAMQGGTHAAKMIIADMKGAPRKPFRYHDKGSMATIGRRSAVLQTAHTRLSGWIAWMAWLFVHILFLIGFRNRVSVFVQWAWSYLTWQRGARLITGPVTPGLKAEGYFEAPAAPPSDAAAAEAVGNKAAADETGWMGGDTHQAAAGRA